jgi:uncharacterized protein (TIGR02246 family)
MRLSRLVAPLVVVFSATVFVQTQRRDPTLVARDNEFTAATKAKDAAKTTAFYAEDAVMFNDGKMVKGRAAIQKDTEAQLKTGLADISTKTVDARTSGDLGYTFGTFSFAGSASREAGRTGSYLTVWKRVGGQWLIAYDTYSNDPRPSPSK